MKTKRDAPLQFRHHRATEYTLNSLVSSESFWASSISGYVLLQDGWRRGGKGFSVAANEGL